MKQNKKISMKKILLIILLSLFVLSGEHLGAQKPELNFDKITVVSDDNYPPFIFRDSDGNLQGILPDQWKLWEQKTGIKVRLIGMDWDKAQKALKEGKADVIDTMFFTEERAKFYDFTKPYTKIEVPIFFHKNISGINNIKSVKGFSIAVKKGDACINVFRKHGIKEELVTYNSYEDIVKAAAEKKIRMFCIDNPPALYFLYKYNIAEKYRHSLSLYTGEFHRAVRKGRTDLLTVIEDGFSRISDKEYAAIHEKWYGATIPTIPGDVKYIGIILAVVVAIVVIFFLLNLFLRKQVKKKTFDLFKTNQLLRESEERFRVINTSALDAVVLMDDAGKAVLFNPAAEKMFGFAEAECIGKDVHSLLMPERYREAFSRGFQEFLRTGTGPAVGKVLELSAKRKDGQEIPIEIAVAPIRRGGHYWASAVIRDITERKRAEEALRASEEKLARSKKMESLGLLAGGVAHDLNNVLAGIVSYPELLLLDLPKDSKLRKPIETMQETGHRAAAIVQDLITVARGVAIAKEPLNLNAIVEDYLLSLEFKKLEQFHSTVTIKTNLDNDLLNISGSDAHLRKVVMNLVSNASEAIEGSGNVIISTMNRYVDRPISGYDDVNVGEYAVLSVSDDGPGISPDDLERIFEPFYTKKVMGRSGTGLGLAVVWNVVQDLKGYLDVISDENGTTFELYFPITRDEVSGKDLAIPIKDYQGNGETILVVDDVESQREIACEMLETLGYKTKAVSSGEEAVEYLKAHKVDLILLDMIMDPGINGRETYEKIIKIHPNQKAVIASGFAETDDVKEAQKLGAGQYIKKPLTLEKMGIAVRDELKK